MDKVIDSSYDLKIYENEKNFKVVAGPGAGKTHLIIENIKYIVQNSKKIKNYYRKVLCITYTNIAVDEIKRRIGNNIRYAYISTIHSFLYQNVIKLFQKQLKILIKEMYDIYIDDKTEIKVRNEGESVLSNTTVEKIKDWLKDQINMDESMIDLLTKDVMTNCVLSFDKKSKIQLDDTDVFFLSDKKNNNIPKSIRMLIKKYLWGIQGVLDFDEILFFSIKMIEKFPFIKYNIRYKYPYIFIDEHQDTNYIQYEIIKLIFDSNDSTIGFIGDIAQSIYSFQGADCTIFESKEFDNKEQLEYVIEGNRRSTENIINFCNFIRKNETKLSKQKCVSNVYSNKKVKIVILTNKKLNAREFVDENTTVLCRRFIDLFEYVDISDQNQRDKLAELYRRHNYFYIRDLNNDFNNESFNWIKSMKFVCTVSSGITNKNFSSLFDEIGKYLEINKILEPNVEESVYYGKFLNVINEIASVIKDKQKIFSDILIEINNIFQKSGFTYKTKIYDEENDKLEPCYEFIDDFTLQTVYEIGNKVFTKESKYMTIHKSKGKEYKKVLVDLKSSKINSESKKSPIELVTNPKIYDTNEIELSEFTRIFYVGISRAIDELIVVLEGKNEHIDRLKDALHDYMKKENIKNEFYEMIIK